MEDDITENTIRQVISDYRAGKLDKYEAMDALDLDGVRELFALLARHGVGPELTPDPYQSDPSAPPVKDFFTQGE